MQDFYDSRAAVDAMAALQQKIHDLEIETGQLRKESAQLRSIVESNEQHVNEKNEMLSREADKTQKMLESASETLIELRRIKAENRKLQSHLNSLKEEIERKEKAQKTEYDKILGQENDAKHAELLEQEIEELFSLLLTPPDFPIEKTKNITFNPTIISITTYSLPATIQTVVQYLHNLPFPFCDQKYRVKREIVTTLMTARNMCCKLMDEIHQLEIQKAKTAAKKKIQKDIDSKMSYLAVLTQAMAKFSM
ncbi:hypothetical protein TRFO_06744 [Tritrichomonas foetus]|uniref:Uncharacterized protein n=1 Tax=Tritrichomonas foetus TaxID=1144522 RepID=A0A1J4JWQ9_9EUKA|nr:hypothetical protein TRFO_06744 [Tritrichomonas foetus]|eukprot:OHT03106.1 hypothetical protein TRFO_06744 [Tritrichomonas foetus]